MPIPATADGHIFLEYWDVSKENEERWYAYYNDFVIGAYHACRGYMGSMIVRRGPWWDQPRKAIHEHFGLRTRGIRTNTSINMSALIQHEYTYAVINVFTAELEISRIIDDWTGAWEQLQPDWRERHPDTDDPHEALSRDFFALADNHWDVTYDILRQGMPGVAK